MDKQYHQLVEDILNHGERHENRTGVDTLSLFGYQMRFNLQEGFPAATTKKLAWKSVVAELLWFLEGNTDERRLAEITYDKDRAYLAEKYTIWTANADKQGVELGYTNQPLYKELGPVYGHQWRDFDGNVGNKGVDQIARVINEIKTDPSSRRIIFSAWNPNQIHRMALPPCHILAHFKVSNDKLNCMLTMRSNDAFLGAPFNIASYALLTHLFARECDLEVGEFIYSIGDAHIYLNHIDQIKEQLSREPFPLPTLKIDDSFSLQEGLADKFPYGSVDKIRLVDYHCHESIKAPMAV